MKNFRRKALPALTMLVIAILCLTGVTYSWFTENDAVSAKDINVNVVEANGNINVALTQAGDYGQSVSLATALPSSREYYPASTNGVLNDSGELNFYVGTVSTDNSAKLSKSEKTTANTNYAKFDLWFESLDDATKKIYFNYSNLYELFGKSAEISGDNAAYASRIAFVYVGKADSKTGSVTENRSIVIVEPYSTTHLSVVKETGKLDYFGLKAEFTASTTEPVLAEQDIKPSNDTDTDYMAKVVTKDTSDYNYIDSETDKTALFTITQGYTHVEVYIWYEGQDVDCINNIAGNDIAMTFKFKAVKQSA